MSPRVRATTPKKKDEPSLQKHALLGLPRLHKKIRIAIAEDHAILREALADLLDHEPDFQVDGKARNGKEVLELLRDKPADVLILDLTMPECDGFQVLRAMNQQGLRVPTVVLTASEDKADYAQVVRLGGRGLVIKSQGAEKVFAAVRSVAQGKLAFCNDVAQQVLGAVAPPPGISGALGRLSARERQIADLIARGMKNSEIACELAISYNTVKVHVQTIFSKTGVRDRLELMTLALTTHQLTA
jgi:DNA-binding NarL/FixJ family response regulator